MEKLLSFLYKKRIYTISFDVLLRVGAFVFLVLYWFWEIYWYREVGLAFVKWHTHLMPYITLGIILLVFILSHTKGPVSGLMVNLTILIASLVFALFVVEVFFILSGSLKTVMEKKVGYYFSPYRPNEKGHYYIWPASKAHWLTTPEYTYMRTSNSLGFADKEWDMNEKRKCKRILAIGDSFTEGDGAPYDSSFVSLLRRKLTTSGDSFYIMNAGVCGSDPFDNYINYKDLLGPYKPDFILQSLGSGDMNTDILIRGGLERFKEDGTTVYSHAPWWEPLYAVSYISRIFFAKAGYNQLLKKNDIPMTEIARINKSTIDLFAKYSSLCRDRGCKLIVVVHPQRDEVESGRYQYDLKPLLACLAKDTSICVLDLLPCYREYIAHHHSIASQYFWPQDGHHNGKGYEMMAETILQNINPLINDPIPVAHRKGNR